MSSIRPCPYCGNPHFLLVPNLSVMLRQPTSMGHMSVNPDYLEMNLTVCTGCQRVEIFARNGRELQAVPGAHLISAAAG